MLPGRCVARSDERSWATTIWGIGAPGFEPGTFWSQTRRATGLRYAPRLLRITNVPAFAPISNGPDPPRYSNHRPASRVVSHRREVNFLETNNACRPQLGLRGHHL